MSTPSSGVVGPLPQKPDVAGDNRPFVSVYIINNTFSALLDSGATVSCLGGDSFKQFLDLGIELTKVDFNVTTADGSSQSVLGTLTLPVTYNTITREVVFYVIPSLSPNFILGVNFWKQFRIAPELFPDVHEHDLSGQINELRAIRPASSLSVSESRALSKIISKFDSISYEKKGLGLTHLVKHKIVTTGPPIKQRYYPLSPARQRQLDAEVDEMLSLGVIRPSRSPWSSPVIIVQKKDGTGRFCLDSRKLNNVTIRDSYPLPHIARILDNLGGARYVSSIDLSKAFWQVPLDEDSCEKTAFVVPGRGLFEFTRMPFGLKNAPSELQRLADALFGPEFDDNAFCYLDDLILISEDFDSHIKLLNKVFERLRDAGLTINQKKSEFCRSELKYLGYIVDSQGLRTDPVKIVSIKDFPIPKNAKGIRAFLGLSGYFRRFIKGFSSIAAPLTKLTGSKNGVSNFKWTPEAEKAFNDLKQALISAPVLSCPNFSEPFAIHCDASSVGVGGVLIQNIDGAEHPIAYYSRCLNKHERNYGITERELLAVLDSVTHFRPYIEGAHFTVVTDHSSLKWLGSLSNPSGRLARWSSRLSQFSFDVVHRKGTQHIVPDVLSRMDVALVSGSDLVDTTDKWFLNVWKGCQEFPQRFQNFQIRDNELFRHMKTKLALCEDTAWKKVVPHELRQKILSNEHESSRACHPGVFKTYKRIQLRYYWPKLYKDVKQFVNNCMVCKAHKICTAAPNGVSSNPKKVTRPMQMLSLDLVGPLPRSYSGFTTILSCVDVFSKYTWLFPLRKGTARSIIKNLEENIFLVHGVPRTIVCDNGRQFVSKEFKDLLHNYNIPPPFYNSYYTPQNNVVERYNQTLGTALSILAESDHRNWSKFLPQIQSAMNNSVNCATNYTPYFLMHGREQILDGDLHRIPIDNGDTHSERGTLPSTYAQRLQSLANVYEQVSAALLKAYQTGANRYNLRRRNVTYQVGDVVWRRNFVQSNALNYFSQKLSPRFVQNVVVKKKSDLVYTLADLKGKISGDFHIKDIVKSDNVPV